MIKHGCIVKYAFNCYGFQDVGRVLCIVDGECLVSWGECGATWEQLRDLEKSEIEPTNN